MVMWCGHEAVPAHTTVNPVLTRPSPGHCANKQAPIFPARLVFTACELQTVCADHPYRCG